MAVITISALADAFEECSDERNQFLNIKTGEIVSVPEDPWMVDEVECNELIEEIEESDNYIMLPNQHELGEFDIMREFAYDYPDRAISEKLISVLHRQKPYRNFKDTINYNGIASAYYEFRHDSFIKKAKVWCEYNDISYEF